MTRGAVRVACGGGYQVGAQMEAGAGCEFKGIQKL